MKQKLIVIGIILAFVLLIGGASLLYRSIGQNLTPEQLAVQTAPTGETKQPESTRNTASPTESETPSLPKAPDFTVYDSDGNEVHLSDYVGKPVVINFWASWCGPCKMEMPDFHDKFLELGEDVQFLMINMTDGSRETVESARQFIEEQAYTFPVLFDTQYSAATVYGIYSIPSTYFIDAAGNAIAKASGAIDGDTLQRGIDLIR